MSCETLDRECLTAGDSKIMAISVTDASGADATATEFDMKWVRQGDASAALTFDEGSSQITIVSGTITLTLATSDTTSLLAGIYNVEWSVTTSGGTETARQVVEVKARL